MKFVIVKYAAKSVWKYHFNSNPIDGVHHSYSCHNTYTGNMVGILSYYEDKNKAEIDCNKINNVNPSCYYAVCPLIS